MTEDNCRFCGTKLVTQTEGGCQCSQVCPACHCVFFLGKFAVRQLKCWKCGKIAFKAIEKEADGKFGWQTMLFVHNVKVTPDGFQYEGCSYELGAEPFV